MRYSCQIKDEYDVQDLLHSLLKLDFNDIRTEEWTPSYAGAASRIHLVLKDQKIVIESKKTSKALKTKEIGKQLIEDIAKYKEYPRVDTLICFIYDPDSIITNPDGFKSDLEKLSKPNFKVTVIISPNLI